VARENIDVTVELHDQLSRPAHKAEDSVDDLRDSVDDLNESLVENEAATAAAADATDGKTKATKESTKATDESTKSTKRHRKATDDDAKSQTVLQRVLSKTGKKFKEAGKNGEALGAIMKAMKVPAIVTAVTLLGQAVAALGAAGFAAISGLAPLVGTLGAMPTLLSAMGQAMATVKMGFKGIGAGLKVLTDPTSTTATISEAMEKLSPAAQHFAYQLAAVTRQTHNWKGAIQAAMLPGFATALYRVSGQFPVIKKGLVDTGRTMGDFAKRLGVMVAGWDDLGSIMARNNRILRGGMLPALLGVVSMFHDFLGAGGPLAERFAKWLGTAATNLAAMTAAGAQDGRLEGFLNRAGDLAAGVGKFLGDISVGLFNIGKQSGAMSTMMGHSFGTMAANFRAWTESMGGQASIRQYFQDAMPVVRELGLLVKDVLKTLGGLAAQGDLAPLIAQIRTELVPALNNLLTGVTGALGPAIIDLATAWVQFESSFSYQPIEAAASAIAGLAKGVTALIHTIPGMGNVVATFITLGIVFKTLALLGKMTGITVFVGSMVSKTGAVRVFTQALQGNTLAIAENEMAQSGAARAGGAVRGELQKMSAAYQWGAKTQGVFAGATGAAAQGLSSMKRGLGGLVGALGGPWMLAMAAAVGVVMVFMNKSKEQKQRIDDVAMSLDQQTGALTANTRATVAKKLQDEGAYASAKKLGISMTDVTDAALGNEAAMERVRSKLVAYDGDAADALAGNKYFGVSLTSNGRSAMEVARSIGQMSGAVDTAKAKTRELAEATAKSTHAVAGYVPTASRAAKVDEQLGRSQAVTAAATTKQKIATIGLKNSLLQLHSATLKNMGGDIGFQAAMDDLDKTMRKGSKTLDIHTAAGRENKQAMIDLANSAGQVGGSAKHQQAAMEQARDKIKEWASQAFNSDKRAKAFTDRMIGLQKAAQNLPPQAGIDVTVDGIDYAKQRLAELDTKLYQMTSRTRIIQVETRLGTARRHGGPVDANTRYTVGEAGPELYKSIISGRVEVIGRAGQEQRTFTEPGVVLPNEYYEAAAGRFPDRPSADAAPLPTAAGPVHSTRADTGGGGTAVLEVPDVHLHFHGDGSALSPEDVKRAAKAAWREYEKERKERR
jgi:hypothetical protein